MPLVGPPATSTLFPYTTLFRSRQEMRDHRDVETALLVGPHAERRARDLDERDRKSTRLNSSHLVISYAVFCLKKKNNSSAPRLASSQAARSSARWSATPSLAVK